MRKQTTFNDTSYCSRTFISPDTHSSGYIMCYYNPRGINTHYRSFIRIADCARAFDMVDENLNNIKHMMSFISKLKTLLCAQRGSFVMGGFKFCIKQAKSNLHYKYFRISKHYTKKALQALKEAGNIKAPKEKVMVNIHMDPETCNLDQWNRKIKTLYDEICKFEVFLKTTQYYNSKPLLLYHTTGMSCYEQMLNKGYLGLDTEDYMEMYKKLLAIFPLSKDKETYYFEKWLKTSVGHTEVKGGVSFFPTIEQCRRISTHHNRGGEFLNNFIMQFIKYWCRVNKIKLTSELKEKVLNIIVPDDTPVILKVRVYPSEISNFSSDQKTEKYTEHKIPVRRVQKCFV